MKNLNDLLVLLAKSDIEFVVIGGFAGVLHGSTLVTRDLDVCTVLTSENIKKLRVLFKDFHPKHRMTSQKLSFLTIPPEGQSLNNLYLETDLGIVDFISVVSGVGDLQRLFLGAETIEIKGEKIKVMGLSDLIKAKQSLGRDKDKLAAMELLAIQAKKKS
jgi:hypothetical protein